MKDKTESYRFEMLYFGDPKKRYVTKNFGMKFYSDKLSNKRKSPFK